VVAQLGRQSEERTLTGSVRRPKQERQASTNDCIVEYKMQREYVIGSGPGYRSGVVNGGLHRWTNGVVTGA
jgi:hypothetical protein